MPLDSQAQAHQCLTPSRLNRMVRLFLDDAFGCVSIEGEVSNLAKPRSGHIYFSLKDDKAQVRCAWFRPRHNRQAALLSEGDRVLLQANVSVFEPRGDYQLIVESLAPAGAGDLAQRFEQLKQKLLAEGLFDPARKKNLPAMPGSIGLVTSPTGAAIRDLLAVFERRFPLVHLTVYASAVQGQRAPAELIDALRRAERGHHDLLILARGGGSLEDLQAFNDENLARAIAACSTPLISGVGHETDVTIADLVADQRAATPSVAAESAVPDIQQLRQRLSQADRQLQQHLRRRLMQHDQHLDVWLQRLRAQSPAARVRRQQERLMRARQSLIRAARQSSNAVQTRLENLDARLQRLTPGRNIAQHRRRLHELCNRLSHAARRQHAHQQQCLAALSLRLDELSPLRTLARGYAVVRDEQSRVIRHPQQVQDQQPLELILEQGRLKVRVQSSGSNSV